VINLNSEIKEIDNAGSSRYRKPKKGNDDGEMGDLGETQKRYRHNAYYQPDYSTMKTDLLYDKFINRGGLMHQSQQSLKELHSNARSKSTLGNHNLNPVVSNAYQRMEPIPPKKSWNNPHFMN
jgi:hypothetical protein